MGSSGLSPMLYIAGKLDSWRVGWDHGESLALPQFGEAGFLLVLLAHLWGFCTRG